MRQLVFFSLLLMIFACQRKTYTLEQLPDNYLAFGQGGGFSGQETTTYLFSNGQRVQFQSLSRDTVELPALKRRQARRLLASADSVFLHTPAEQQPGNRYHFIHYQAADTLYQSSWGAMGYKAPEVLLGLYRRLRTLE